MRTTSWSGTRRSFPKATRNAILRRDPICVHCHQQPATEADHIIPHAEGGTDDPTNGQGLCRSCHARKTRAEQQRGQARRRAAHRHPAEPHPGIIATPPHR